MLDVSVTASYEITLVRLTIISSDWRSQIFEKKIAGPNSGQMDQNWAQN